MKVFAPARSTNLCVLVNISLCGVNSVARAALQEILLTEAALVSLNPSNTREREQQATHTTRTPPGHGRVLAAPTHSHKQPFTLVSSAEHTHTASLEETTPLPGE